MVALLLAAALAVGRVGGVDVVDPGAVGWVGPRLPRQISSRCEANCAGSNFCVGCLTRYPYPPSTMAPIILSDSVTQ
jgi:hypothetical protein